jgi:hypothetical protein
MSVKRTVVSFKRSKHEKFVAGILLQKSDQYG